MLTRRLLLSSALTFAAFSAHAQHVDLEPAPDQAAPADMPVQRRWMMEDAWGNVHTDEDNIGRFVLIYFGYTGCPDVCPTSLSTLADVLAGIGEDDAKRVQAYFVTVDPAHDTAKLLQDYTAAFDERIVPLRGPQAYLDHMVGAFNARYEKHVPDPAKPEHYSYDHTASIALVGPDSQLATRYPHGMAAEEIAADLKARIAAAPPPPVEAPSK